MTITSKSNSRAGQGAEEKTRRLSLVLDGYSDRLRALTACTPKFKSGQIRALWPHIRDAIAAGHKLKQIWECLGQNGLALSYSRFRYYVATLKRSEPREQQHTRSSVPFGTPSGTRVNISAGETPRDALANLRERMNNRPGFEFDSRPPDVKKLI
jgi:hypothetical protein